MNKFNHTVSSLKTQVAYNAKLRPHVEGAQFHLLQAVINVSNNKSIDNNIINAMCARGYTDTQIDNLIKLLQNKKKKWARIDKLLGLVA